MAICARGAERLEKTAAEIRSHGGKALAIPADATRAEDARRVMASRG